MAKSPNSIDVYLEIGAKKTFAGALDWPGWSRSGRDEASALQALLDYGPRYAAALDDAGLGFRKPAAVSAFFVAERLEGNSTTDFGAPGISPSADSDPVDESDLERLQALLAACWRAFDVTVAAAQGRELRKGPRGGGRDLEKIVEHVVGAEQGYLSALGWKVKKDKQEEPESSLRRHREEILMGLAAAARGELPERGPRGGRRWTPRYFCRRTAWHVLDHAWEIEDRVI